MMNSVTPSRASHRTASPVMLHPGPDVAQRLQMEREIGTAHRDPDPPATQRQGAHQMPADKARTAKDRHKPVCLYQFIRHRRSSLRCKA
jgi:hypothetical protein